MHSNRVSGGDRGSIGHQVESQFLMQVEWPVRSRSVYSLTFSGSANPVGLLIEHNIGVRKRPLELLEVDTDTFADIEAEVE